MAQIKPINPEHFSDRHWTAPQDYSFAKDWGSLPLSLAEVYPIASAMPVGFIKQGQDYRPVAITGQHSNRNLFINKQGQWAGLLLPQILRQHPFQLLATGQGNYTLCADLDSPCLVDPPHGHPFFSNGTISKPLQAILDALTAREKDLKGPLAQACQAIAQANLFEPWPLEFKSSAPNQAANAPIVHQGLYRINTEGLIKLNETEVYKLHTSQALPLIYAQRLSTFHLHLLDRLGQAHATTEQSHQVDLDQLFGNEDDNLFKF